MLILAIDTSGKQGSITLARGDEKSFEVIDSRSIAGGTFSAQLIPQIAAALDALKLKKKDIQGIAVTAGPGSFTGLRVGLTAAKGLAEVLHIPIAAISLLEALALQPSADGEYWVALDAQRKEAFVGDYSVAQGEARCLGERLMTQAELAEASHGKAVITPDATIAAIASNAIHIERPGSAEIARIGLRRILAGQTVSVEELDANYLRRSDAEIFAKPPAPSQP
jgi:tRNA threonylcarbamoyladenosine biosynthesis protein TsaB